MRVVVAGVGNAWAGDDGAGPAVIDLLLNQFTLPPNAKLVSLSIPDVSFLELMSGCDTLVVIDAVMGGGSPGTVQRLVWQPGILKSKGVERASVHGFGLREVFHLAMVLNRLPEQIILWGVEAVDTRPGAELSPQVATALPAIAAQLHQELWRITNDNRNRTRIVETNGFC